jgi:hypothetical protein
MSSNAWKVEVDGVPISDFTKDPTGRFTVDPSFYNLAINATLWRELHFSTYGSSMPRIDLNDRDSLIRWMAWNDGNATVTDEDSAAEGAPPLTLQQARELFLEILTSD